MPTESTSSTLPQLSDQLCAKLTSMTDDCTGTDDRMRFTISGCVDQDPPGSPPKLLNAEPNEGKLITYYLYCYHHFKCYNKIEL